MKKDYLLEIGTEEIPAGFVIPALENLKERFINLLQENRITFDDVEVFGTPRRMTLYAKGLIDKQPDIEEEVLGPPKKVAIDDNGNFTKAGIGFANSNNVDLKDIKFFTRDKKEYIGFIKKRIGGDTSQILSENLAQLILSINFPKSMRWKEGDIRFVRPIHWILSLLGGEVVKFNIGEIVSSDLTYGHRFMSNRAFKIKNFDEYKKTLNDNFVIWNNIQRKETIKREARKIAESINAVIDEDEELIDTINFLCEYPCPLLGNFEERFLNLPQEILINTMKKHQKYIPLRDKNGKLLPNFITFSNTKVEDEKVVINGNSRVIRARFSDAEYYFEKDKKIQLSEHVEKLKKVLFQIKLGSYYEKTERLVKLSKYLSSVFYPDLTEKAERSALLSKADLVTGMVYEFPSLQGIIGGELAKIQGEDKDVADAIYEHYLPQSPDDSVPQSKTGIILSLADKLDNLVGFFGIGLSPKGASDPYGLRRQAIGIIRIITENNLYVDFTELLKFSYDCLKDKLTMPLDKLISIISEFIENRFYYQMEQQGFNPEIISSVTALHPRDLSMARDIIVVMNEEYKKPEFKDLAFSVKRVSNITKGVDYTDFDLSLFKEEAEFKLFESYKKVKVNIENALSQNNIRSVPSVLLSIKPDLDEYFDKVLVMDKQEDVKRNRLGFLNSLKAIFEKILDFSKIQI
ncbi:MAG: glycine--tRNA ligase subunit beta [Proteobacteria bacterium]|nr:glycine--tRNA ligase subunit beta [Pseudomonadota bacterium]